jgi:uncharacterized membrane protein HdeD (DUF308 family)
MLIIRSGIDANWKWLAFFGSALVALGLLSLTSPPAETTAYFYAVGVCMLVGAVLQFSMWFLLYGFGLLFVSAILYTVAGLFAVANPELAAKALTLALAVMLILSGAARFRSNLTLQSVRGRCRGWIVASGVASIFTEALLIAGWPVDEVGLPGFVLSIDLIWQGAMAIGFAFALRTLVD